MTTADAQWMARMSDAAETHSIERSWGWWVNHHREQREWELENLKHTTHRPSRRVGVERSLYAKLAALEIERCIELGELPRGGVRRVMEARR